MEWIEIIGTIVGTAGVVLGGLLFIIKREKKSAVDNYHLNKVETDVSQLTRDMSDVKLDLSSIKSILSQRNSRLVINMTNKKSPRVLNELGQNIVKQVNGEKLLNINKEFFFKNIDRMNPKTALDVENAANYACIGYTNNDIFNDIKMFVYNAPEILVENKEGGSNSYALTLEDVCYALSIPLRYMYLKEHPEILQ